MSTMHKSNILVSFDSIIDIDIGLMRLIKMEYNTDFFYQDIVNAPEFIWKDLLERRNIPNPLSIIMDDETEEEMDLSQNIYDQFINEEYSKILDLSPLGALANVVNSNMYSKDLLRLTVLCKNELEKSILDIKGVTYNEAIICDRKEIYTPKFEIISEKNVWDYLDYVHLERNTLLVPDYRFNIFIFPEHEDTLLLPKEIIEALTPQNEFKIYNAYTIDRSVFINEDGGDNDGRE